MSLADVPGSFPGVDAAGGAGGFLLVARDDLGDAVHDLGLDSGGLTSAAHRVGSTHGLGPGIHAGSYRSC